MLAFAYPEFLNALQDFVLHRISYYEHISHQNADPFLTQSIKYYNQTLKIQQLIVLLSRHLAFSYDPIDFAEVHSKYQSWYVHLLSDNEVVEIEITELHQRIMKNILNAINPVKQLIFCSEADYWKMHNFQLYQEAECMSVDEFKEHSLWLNDC